MKRPTILPLLIPNKFSSVFFLFLIVFSSISFAQEYEHVLHLKNGWVLHGQITYTKDSLVSITTESRNIFVFQRSEIENQVFQLKPRKKRSRIYADPKVIPHIHYREKGYFMLLQVGNLFGNSISEEEGNSIFTPEMIHGYRLNRFLSAGVGLGFNLIKDGAILPVFLDLRGDLLKQKATPHYYAKGGYAFPLYTQEDQLNGWIGPVIENFKADGGPLVEGGLGMKIHAVSGLAWVITGGYRVQQLTERFNSFENRVKQRYIYQRFAFNIGLVF